MRGRPRILAVAYGFFTSTAPRSGSNRAPAALALLCLWEEVLSGVKEAVEKEEKADVCALAERLPASSQVPLPQRPKSKEAKDNKDCKDDKDQPMVTSR